MWTDDDGTYVGRIAILKMTVLDVWFWLKQWDWAGNEGGKAGQQRASHRVTGGRAEAVRGERARLQEVIWSAAADHGFAGSRAGVEL